MAKKKARKAPARKTALAAPPPLEAAPAVETSPAPIEAAPAIETAPAEPVLKRRSGMVGVWAYIIGLVIAAGAAVFVQPGLDFLTYVVLAVLGVVVGLLNITEDEILLFLVATVALVISANSVRSVVESLPMFVAFLKNVIIFTAASAFIVSLKALFKVAKSE
jgi:hypothetical protein